MLSIANFQTCKTHFNSLLTASVLACAMFSSVKASDVSVQKTQTGQMSAQAKFDHYVKARKKRLLSPDGWVSLAGLFWLEDGKYTIGSAHNNRIIFPKEAPQHVGIITIKDHRIDFQAQDPSVRINGLSVTTAELSVKDQTKVTFKPFSFFMIEREKGFAIRLKNAQNPALKTFQGFDFFPFNPKLIVRAKLIKPAANAKTLLIQTVYGTFRHEKSAGFLQFSYEGKPYQLQAVDDGPNNPLFVMFTDATSEKLTYGAGRFLDVAQPDANGQTLINFNEAYNPPCAFTHFATCPLPPRSNRLSIAINAGEKFSGHP